MPDMRLTSSSPSLTGSPATGSGPAPATALWSRRQLLARAATGQKERALGAAAAARRRRAEEIIAANAEDMTAARARKLSAALLDRLALDAKRVEAMAQGIDDIIGLADPVGGLLAEWREFDDAITAIERVWSSLHEAKAFERLEHSTHDGSADAHLANDASLHHRVITQQNHQVRAGGREVRDPGELAGPMVHEERGAFEGELQRREHGVADAQAGPARRGPARRRGPGGGRGAQDRQFAC